MTGRSRRDRSAVGPHGLWPHRSQYGELWRPATPRQDSRVPAVVLYHGGFWRPIYTRRLMDRLARDVTARGWAAWNLEYRRVGAGGGGWPATFEDACCGLQAVADLEGIDLDRIATCGHSTGGYLALYAAMAASRGAAVDQKSIPGRKSASSARSRIVPVGAVSLAGVVDLAGAARLGLGSGAVQRLMGGSPDEFPDRYRVASLLDALPSGLRQVVVNGTRDTAVPVAMAEAYVPAAIAAGGQAALVLLEGTDHMSLIDPDGPAWSITVQRLTDLLA